MTIQGISVARFGRIGLTWATLFLVPIAGPMPELAVAQEPALLHVAEQEPVLRPIPTDETPETKPVRIYQYPGRFTSGQESASRRQGELQPPKLLFGSTPVGNGVQSSTGPTSAGPQLSRRFQASGSQPPQALPINGPARPSRISDRTPVHTARLPKRNDVVRQRIQSPALNQAVPRHQVLLAGESRFRAGIENSFAVVVVNSGSEKLENLEVILEPAQGFKVTVLDRECEVDRNSGAVRWVIPVVEAGVNEVIQFRGVANRRGEMTHKLRSTDGNGKKTNADFSSIAQ